jgi:hypothetical protein
MKKPIRRPGLASIKQTAVTRPKTNESTSINTSDIFAYSESSPRIGDMQTLVNTKIIESSGGNPDLLDTLQKIVDKISDLHVAVYGRPILIYNTDGFTSGAPSNPTDFSVRATLDNIVLSWIPASADFTYYELRKGTSWDNADKLLTTNNLIAYLDPVIVGTHTYLLRSIGNKGVYGELRTTSITIPPIGSFTVSSTVVSNSITLAWTIPTSIFRIEYYIIKRQGVQIATNTGTFFAISEQAGGNYTYAIVAVDIAGNRSEDAEARIFTTGVTDYIFYSKLIWKQNGLSSNSKISGNKIYFCILNETYQAHFSSRGWASPQAQINAGYPLWLSPFATTAWYEELFDFTTVVNNVVLTVSFGYEIYYGNFTFGLEIRTSTDGINYAAPQSASSFFVSSLRYVKAKINITAQDDKSLMALNNLSVSLNVKRENDGGESTSYATDPLGTSVNFNKAFVDVEGITVTPISDSSTFATHAFDDIPYPTSFRVRIFDNAGVRITRGFRWNARGII